uniref:Uncharacterized protein n=1 Tax=Rhizophora mucronata TaxID=61149 RepID=A0A2P2Q079_RHIMU
MLFHILLFLNYHGNHMSFKAPLSEKPIKCLLLNEISDLGS